MTSRLYYTDSYLRDFTARIVDAAGDRVYLDRTAFYPTSGGQLFDRGTIGGAAVVDVIDDGERIAHVIDGVAPAGDVECAIEWPRRFGHMQQHSGQHLLSAVFASLFDLATVSVHLGEESNTLDLRAASLPPERIAEAEDRANAVVAENRPLAVTFEEAPEGLRKQSARAGTLRIVEIAGLDRSACGGTHVRATGEIGAISIRSTEKIRDSIRVEFLCGARATARARDDRDALARIARIFSSSPDAAPDRAAELAARIKNLEKENRRLAAIEAEVDARRAYESAAPDASGLRRRTVRGPLDRAAAQAWCALAGTLYVGVCDDPPSLLIASSADSGVDASARLRDAVTPEGGRGGGSPRLAQGSLPSLDALARAAGRV